MANFNDQERVIEYILKIRENAKYRARQSRRVKNQIEIEKTRQLNFLELENNFLTCKVEKMIELKNILINYIQIKREIEFSQRENENKQSNAPSNSIEILSNEIIFDTESEFDFLFK